MKIAIIGSNGVVGKPLVQHFQFRGHQVLSVDKGTKLTLQEAAAVADVVWIVTMPIEEVACVIHEAVSVMKRGAFLIHGTSVERPVQNKIDTGKISRNKVIFGHVHFHFRPELPLTRTLNGMNITVALLGMNKDKLLTWCKEEFEPHGAKVILLPPGRHDDLTSVSMLVHMIVAVLVLRVWECLPKKNILDGLGIGGPPCRFLARAVLRVATAPLVAENVLLSHSRTKEVLQLFQGALSELVTIVNHREKKIANNMAAVRASLGDEFLSREAEITAMSIRFEADLNASNFWFRFPSGMNKCGLLAGVIALFDSRGIDKSTTIAQNNADGSCTITIGVYRRDQSALEAEKSVQNLITMGSS